MYDIPANIKDRLVCYTRADSYSSLIEEDKNNRRFLFSNFWDMNSEQKSHNSLSSNDFRASLMKNNLPL